MAGADVDDLRVIEVGASGWHDEIEGAAHGGPASVTDASSAERGVHRRALDQVTDRREQEGESRPGRTAQRSTEGHDGICARVTSQHVVPVADRHATEAVSDEVHTVHAA